MEYVMHFLRKQEHSINIKNLIDFFESKGIVKIKYTEIDATFHFKDESIGVDFVFMITRRSNINDMYIDPAFYNLNFYISFPIIRNECITIYTLQLVEELCKIFELYVFCVYVNEITEFDFETHYMIWKNQ